MRKVSGTVFLFLLLASATQARAPVNAIRDNSFGDIAGHAQLALDTQRYGEAAELYELAAQTHPERVDAFAFDWAWTHVEMGCAALKSKDYDAADMHFVRALQIDPDTRRLIADVWSSARLEHFWQRYNMASSDPARANWSSIISYASETLELIPNLPAAHYALGMSYEKSGYHTRAQSQYATAAGNEGAEAGRSIHFLRSAAREAANRVRPSFRRPSYPLYSQSDPGPLQTLRQGQVVIYHHNAQLARRFARALDYHLSTPVLGGVLEGTPLFPVDLEVYLYRDKAEYLKATGQPEWSGGCAGVVKKNGRVVTMRIHLFQTASYLMGNAISHELAHIRLDAHRIRPPRLPAWIAEGVATSTEIYDRRSYHGVLSNALSNGTLPGTSQALAHFKVPDDTHSVFYAHSHVMVDALVRQYGPRHFSDFVAALNRTDQVTALWRVYAMTPEDFDRLIVDWIDSYGEEHAAPIPTGMARAA